MVQEVPTKTTPPFHNESDDPSRGPVDYPNYHGWQGRDGSTYHYYNQTAGNEFMKEQHRTGTGDMIDPEGLYKTVAVKNRENITYGKNVSYTSGANDSRTVGDYSNRVDGSERTTVGEQQENTVNGPTTSSAKSYAFSTPGGFNVSAQNSAFLAEGGMVMKTTNGPTTIAAAGGNLNLGAVPGSGGETGSVAMGSGGAITALAKNAVSLQGKTMHLASAGGATYVMDGGNIYLNCTGVHVPPPQAHKAGKQSYTA